MEKWSVVCSMTHGVTACRTLHDPWTDDLVYAPWPMESKYPRYHCTLHDPWGRTPQTYRTTHDPWKNNSPCPMGRTPSSPPWVMGCMTQHTMAYGPWPMEFRHHCILHDPWRKSHWNLWLVRPGCEGHRMVDRSVVPGCQQRTHQVVLSCIVSGGGFVKRERIINGSLLFCCFYVVIRRRWKGEWRECGELDWKGWKRIATNDKRKIKDKTSSTYTSA